MQGVNIASINHLRGLYRSLPLHSRVSINRLIFKHLRSVGLLDLLRRFGLLTCKGYIPMNATCAQELIAKSRGQIQASIIVERNASTTKPASHLDEQFLDAIQPLIPANETVILDLQDRQYSLRNNHLFDANLNILDECSLQFDKMPVHKKILAKPKQLTGTIAYLSNVEPTNYYHWMCRTLPLLRIYQKQFDQQTIDFFYIGQFPLFDFHQESLKRTGIPMDKVIQQACTADRIIAAFSNRASFYGAAPVIEENYRFSRSLYQDAIESSLRNGNRTRIYVARGNVNRRKVLNEAAIVQQLRKYGFKTVTMDGKNQLEQVKLFAEAEAIVAPHGAALTNLLFIQPRTKVIELFPHGFVNSCYYAMANYGNAKYFYLQGEPTDQAGVEMHNLDLKINIHKLEKICQMAFDSY